MRHERRAASTATEIRLKVSLYNIASMLRILLVTAARARMLNSRCNELRKANVAQGRFGVVAEEMFGDATYRTA
jgi:hypothetical protein